MATVRSHPQASNYSAYIIISSGAELRKVIKMIKVGDSVCFKSGTEQSGRVVAISNGIATVKVWDSMVGEYEMVKVPVARCSPD